MSEAVFRERGAEVPSREKRANEAAEAEVKHTTHTSLDVTLMDTVTTTESLYHSFTDDTETVQWMKVRR